MNGALELFGVRLVGVTAANGRKALFTLIFIAVAWLFSWTAGKLAAFVVGRKYARAGFWAKQAIHVLTTGFVIIGLASIWFDNPSRLATAAGLVTAGLAFALQRVITALAAYLVILRGRTFSVGDRIVMGGVRGDVMDLSFVQTTIMEMGEPPAAQAADPAMWVRSRQYTGRIVTITNDKIFDTPVYNYTREFPYIWEEMQIPISYTSDMHRAEQILLNAAQAETVQISEMSESALQELERRYFIKRTDMGPKVYVRLTDNWIELTVRFIAREHGVRDMKDRMSRAILNELNEAKIGIASGTYEIVGMPPISVNLHQQ